MDLCVESGSVQVILKTAYDEIDRQLSPASLMRQQSFQQVFGEGRLQRIEFCGRVMEWHTRWTDRVRTLFHVNMCTVPASCVGCVIGWRDRSYRLERNGLNYVLLNMAVGDFNSRSFRGYRGSTACARTGRRPEAPSGLGSQSEDGSSVVRWPHAPSCLPTTRMRRRRGTTYQ